MSVITVLSRCAGFSLIVLIAASNATAESELTLAAAERLALERAPVLAEANANVKAATVDTRSVYETPARSATHPGAAERFHRFLLPRPRGFHIRAFVDYGHQTPGTRRRRYQRG